VSVKLSSSPRLRAGAAVLAALAGCGGDLEPDVRWQIVGLLPMSDGACPAPSTAAPQVTGATRVRLTFRDQAARTLRCDTVVALDGDAPFVSVPQRDAPVTIYVEYFDDAGTLLARGERGGVALTGGATVQVHVQATDAYACPLSTQGLARAFHSATSLPNGEVLLLGGLVGAPGGDAAAFAPSAGAYVSSAAEIFDPEDRRFYPLTITGVLPRAFHEVMVLGQEGNAYRLLVVGGIGVGGDPSVVGNIAALPAGGSAAPWLPVAADAAMGRAGTAALPAELLLYDPTTRTVSRTEVPLGPAPRIFGAATQPGAAPGHGLAVLGGLDPAGGNDATHESVMLADGASGGSVAGHPRLGASVTALSATEALVWGGDRLADPLVVRAGDRLTMLDGAPVLDAGPAGTAGHNRAFHAAARFGGGVAMIGGLPVAGAAINDAPFTPFVQVVNVATLGAANLDVPETTPVAYPAAATLLDGDVLFSGGASPGVCTSTLVCPSAQSVRLRQDLGGMPGATATGVPGLARYGHRLTLLPDGAVLVTGGFSPAAQADMIRALRDAELYAPHEAADDPIGDLALGRAPGDVARTPEGTPLAPCTLVGEPVVVDAAAIDAPDVDPNIDAM
jgi:hypothetical protein